jgi:hypothetical protein
MWAVPTDKSGAGAGFLRVLRIPLPIIPSISPSSSQSPGAGTTGLWVATAPSGPNWTPPPHYTCGIFLLVGFTKYYRCEFYRWMKRHPRIKLLCNYLLLLCRTYERIWRFAGCWLKKVSLLLGSLCVCLLDRSQWSHWLNEWFLLYLPFIYPLVGPNGKHVHCLAMDTYCYHVFL